MSWAQRHPVIAGMVLFWIVCMCWAWTWLPPAAAAAGLCWWAARRYYCRRARLRAAADRQHAWYLAGDSRGLYGDYPPPAELS